MAFATAMPKTSLESSSLLTSILSLSRLKLNRYPVIKILTQRPLQDNQSVSERFPRYLWKGVACSPSVARFIICFVGKLPGVATVEKCAQVPGVAAAAAAADELPFPAHTNVFEEDEFSLCCSFFLCWYILVSFFFNVSVLLVSVSILCSLCLCGMVFGGYSFRNYTFFSLFTDIPLKWLECKNRRPVLWPNSILNQLREGDKIRIIMIIIINKIYINPLFYIER